MKVVLSKKITLSAWLILSFLSVCSTILTAQQPTEAQSNIYDLPDGVPLQSLPLDTVLKKLNDASYTMNQNKTNARVKLDTWATLERAKATKDPLTIAKAYKQMGNWHFASITSENADSIYFYDKKALDFLLQTNEKELISKAYKTVGSDLTEFQQYAQAEINLFKGLEIAQSIGSQNTINSIHAALSILYVDTKDYTSALKYSEMVVAAYEKDENIHPLIRAMVTLNHIYVKMGQPEKALTVIDKALALVAKLPENRQEIETINIIAWRGKAYRELKQYDEALKDFEFSWKALVAKVGEKEANGWKGDIGSIYYLKGQYAQAIPFLKDYVHHFDNRKVNVATELAEHAVWLATSYKKIEQADSAYFYLAKAKDIESNISKEELDALKKELRVKYDTEQKEQTIVAQSGQIEQQQQIQWLSYGIGGLLTLLLGGLFFTYRNNKKRNTQLQFLNQNLETTNTALDQRNAQNELLLKEIHHRVKNNLEVVSSLLELQSAQIEDPSVQSVMQASQSRVQSMSILHQKLYQGKDLASIEMKDYFKNLSDNILDTYNAWEGIEVVYNMEEIELDVDIAVPIGLIVNELFTNSLKYAFSDGEKGIITIQMRKVGRNQLYLQVADNGVGKKSGLSPKGTGFGTQLVQLLTRQLNGSMEESSADGVTTTFLFTPPTVY